jgi:hypothetical protein
MVLATGIECASTGYAFAPALHVFVHCQHVFTIPAQYGSFVSAMSWPHGRFVCLACVMATDAGVEFVAAEMLDGDDVEGRVPMNALGQRRDRYAMDCWGSRRRRWFGV